MLDHPRYALQRKREPLSDRENAHGHSEALEWLSPCARVLDLGCGTGSLVSRFARAGKHAIGLTYSAAEARAVVARGQRVVLADAHAFPFADESFDGVACVDMIEHALAPLVVLCEALRVTRIEGRALFFVPGASWQTERYHIIVPTIAQMRHLLGLAGWRIDELHDLTHLRSRPIDDEGMALYVVSRPRV